MVEKFGSDFLEQIGNFATKDEKYPIVYVSPSGSVSGLDLNQLTVEIRCLDIIQKDRANITTILSDTDQILNDIYLFIKEGEDDDLYTVDTPSKIPLNNDLLDYAAGWSMTITLELEGFNVCDIPRP
jgi:hypothetical protein